jgi:ADP-ribose pyrophosphatase YjhB (NUDIX family)
MIVFKDPAVPRHVVQMFCVDRLGRVLVIHRSNKVRSARNIWSLPSGMHDVGETIETTIDRELEEEFAIKPDAYGYLGVYENIAGDPTAKEQYHWVITCFACRIPTFDVLVNREPEKHDQFAFVDLSVLKHLCVLHEFHQSFVQWFNHNAAMIEKGVRQIHGF